MCHICDQRQDDLANRVAEAERIGKKPHDEFGGPIKVLTDDSWWTTSTVSVVTAGEVHGAKRRMMGL